jgi:hypothetical protein
MKLLCIFVVPLLYLPICTDWKRVGGKAFGEVFIAVGIRDANLVDAMLNERYMLFKLK